MNRKEKVLVTGAGGFIGSFLTERLLREGYEVRALLRYTSHKSVGWLSELPDDLIERLEVQYGDILNPRCVKEATAGCSTVFHLAALIGIPYSYVAPASYVQVNTVGTLNILEAARELGVQRVVITSTSEVYGTALFTPMTEDHPLQAQSPYSASKAAADHLALSYHRSFGLPVSIVRPFNTYGPRQSTRAIIPTIMTQALGAKRIEVGNLAPVRDLVFVTDTANGFLAIAQSDACIGEVCNLATERGVSIRELVDVIQSITGSNLPVAETDSRRRPAKSEVFELIGSAARAKDLANWQPKVSLQQGLATTFGWMRNNLAKYDVGAYDV